MLPPTDFELFFHKRRDNPVDDDFHLLKNEPSQLTFISHEEKNDSTKSGKILLLIQLTQPIKEADSQNVLEDNDYTNKTLSDIAEIQKNLNITRIKICVAASGAFIFALGTKFSKAQNKDTVIFHYKNDTYLWGINVTKKISVVKEVKSKPTA
ncbi:SAVED domain-containing protein [Clostridium lundense]|uniref:SAVED domain-containing protein n=1 Tax=Clostridium lundense TaxID=319475 RepID=UPI0004890F35|nr:SAVED domain-containing protein [Clostridium lundense]